MVTEAPESRIDETTIDAAPVNPTWRDLLIDRIVELNPSAEHTFLERFTDGALERYADHLEASLLPRGKRARWIRTDETPAVTGWRTPKERLERLW